MQNPRVKKFVSNNLVAIVMVPSIIGIHYGWSIMQKNRSLVSESEEIELPVVTFAKYLWNRVQGHETPAKSGTAVPAVSPSSSK